MMFCTNIVITSIDPSLGKVDASSMSQQTLMELLVADLDDKIVFMDSENNYRDVSTWEGVDFDKDGAIVSIDWYIEYAPEELDGLVMDEDVEVFIVRPGGKIDLQWFPPTLCKFGIEELELKGSMDTFGLPRGLEIFTVGKNQFYGSFVTKGLPPNIRIVDISMNRLDGPLDLTSLPDGLHEFRAYNNGFTGGLVFGCLPPALKRLLLSKNSFSGNIDLSKLPSTLCHLELDRNNLGQDVLVIDKVVAEDITIHLDYEKFSRITDTDGTAW